VAGELQTPPPAILFRPSPSPPFRLSSTNTQRNVNLCIIGIRQTGVLPNPRPLHDRGVAVIITEGRRKIRGAESLNSHGKPQLILGDYRSQVKEPNGGGGRP